MTVMNVELETIKLTIIVENDELNEYHWSDLIMMIEFCMENHNKENLQNRIAVQAEKMRRLDEMFKTDEFTSLKDHALIQRIIFTLYDPDADPEAGLMASEAVGILNLEPYLK